MSTEITRTPYTVSDAIFNNNSVRISEDTDTQSDIGSQLNGEFDNQRTTYNDISDEYLNLSETLENDGTFVRKSFQHKTIKSEYLNDILAKMENCRQSRPEQENYTNSDDYNKAMDEWDAQMRELETMEQNFYNSISNIQQEENLTPDNVPVKIIQPDKQSITAPEQQQTKNLTFPSVSQNTAPQKDILVHSSNLDINKMVSIENIPGISKSVNSNALIAGVARGTPMNFKEANGKRVNPRYGSMKYEYTHNCQSCVVTYEARRRGYNVEVVGRNKEDKTAQLAEHTSWAYVDSDTGKVCEAKSIQYNKPSELYEQINDMVKPNERYSLKYDWKIRTRYSGIKTGSHIITLEKNEKGNLQLYDPQNGEKYVGRKAIIRKCSNMTNVEILRVDDKSFNAYFADNIMKEPKKKKQTN